MILRLMVFDRVFSMTCIAKQISIGKRACTIAGTVIFVTEYGQLKPVGLPGAYNKKNRLNIF